ncbi:hypothetical protein ABK040_005462 [Willaertia magna]
MKINNGFKIFLVLLLIFCFTLSKSYQQETPTNGDENPMGFDGKPPVIQSATSNVCSTVSCPCGAAVQVGPKCICPECPSGCPYTKDCNAECAGKGLNLETTQQDEQGCDICICKCRDREEVCHPVADCPEGNLEIVYGNVGGIDGCISNCTCKTTPPVCPQADCSACNPVLGYQIVNNPTTGCQECVCNQCPSLNCDSQCQYGFTLQDSGLGDGCKKCKCNCAPLPNCQSLCPFGFTVGTNELGCQACVCKDKPDCIPDDLAKCNSTCPYGGVLKPDQYGCNKCVCLTCPPIPIDTCEQCLNGYDNYTKYGEDGSRCPSCQCRPCPPVNTNCTEVCPYGGVLGTNANGCPACQCEKCPPQKPNCQSVCGNKLNHTYVNDNNGCPTCNCLTCPPLDCESIQCPYGYQQKTDNATMCKQCVCNIPPTCPTTKPNCDTLNCQHGFTYVKDEKGCDTCRCNDGPKCPNNVDCNTVCKYGVLSVTIDPVTGCNQCKCRDYQCPQTNCTDICGKNGIKETTTDANGCLHCTCNEPPVCPPEDVGCVKTCGGLEFTTYKDDYGCTRCSCKKPNCNTVPPNCVSVCGAGVEYKIITDEQGCSQCKCSGTPGGGGNTTCPIFDEKDCPTRCGGNADYVEGVGIDSKGCKYCKCKNCIHCKCCKSKKITVPIVKHVPERIYVPYVVYYDPGCNDKTRDNFLTKEEILAQIKRRYDYVLYIRRLSAVYRRALVHLRVVLQHLVMKGKISDEMYKKSDEVARKRKHQLEEEIKEQKVTITGLKHHLKAVLKLIKQLGFDSHAPAVCLLIGGSRVCGLRPAFVNELSSSYLKDEVFTKKIYTRIPTKIVSIEKNQEKRIVKIVRESATWKIQTIRLSKKVRKAVWKRVIDRLLKTNKKVNKTVRGVLNLMKKEKNNYEKIKKLLKNKKQKRKVVRNILLEKFSNEVEEEARKALLDERIKELNEKHKPESSEKVLETRKTEEIIFLPKDIISQDEEALKTMLAQRFEVNSEN